MEGQERPRFGDSSREKPHPQTCSQHRGGGRGAVRCKDVCCPAAALLPGGEERRPNAALSPSLFVFRTTTWSRPTRSRLAKVPPARPRSQVGWSSYARTEPRFATNGFLSPSHKRAQSLPAVPHLRRSPGTKSRHPQPSRSRRSPIRSASPTRPGTEPRPRPPHGTAGAPSAPQARDGSARARPIGAERDAEPRGCGGGGRAEGKGSTCPRPYSLRVARGPGQAPRLLAEDEDGAGDVVGGALDLVRGQSQELGSPVGEAQRQVRAAAVLGARAASHDAAHEIGHGGLHPREHSTAAAQRGERRTGGGPAELPQRGPGRAGARGLSVRGAAGSLRQRQVPPPPPGAAPAELSPAAAAESCDSAAGCARALPAPPAAPAGSGRTPGTGLLPPASRGGGGPRQVRGGRGRPAAGGGAQGPGAGTGGRTVTCGLSASVPSLNTLRWFFCRKASLWKRGVGVERGLKRVLQPPAGRSPSRPRGSRLQGCCAAPGTISCTARCSGCCRKRILT